jgi:uncharacterized protein YyaL (SSP411 family)
MPNRLADATSPYLLQHADNPVDWYEWGPEPFAAAQARGLPVLLSVGYSACHWCHVMAHESFEDEPTAAYMNEHFVNVKVDREERPDIDRVYMDAVQTMTGRGGWPMTVFMTPDARPFYAGTYFPQVPRGHFPSFMQVLESVTDAWRTRRLDLEEQADRLTQAVQRTLPAASVTSDGTALLDHATGAVLANLDEEHGGFGGAPKFPQAPNLELLARSIALRPDGPHAPRARAALAMTLDRMARGGIYDHLGGGFARYAVDRVWLVPHFEKMLYDNALLARIYVRAAQLLEHAPFETVARQTLDYLIADMRDPAGGLHSAEDADSDGEEGKFYVFEKEEFDEVVGTDAAVMADLYGVTSGGNFEGASILHRPEPLERVAARHGLNVEELAAKRAGADAALRAARARRTRPGRDDKVVTAWNGMALRALSEAAAVLDEPRYTAAATRLAEFAVAELRRPDGRLVRSWRRGRAGGPGFCDDYAALAVGLYSLYQATGDERWFSEAERLTAEMIDLFADPDGPGFFATGRDAEALIARPKNLMDNPTPSDNALAAEALQIHAALTADTTAQEHIDSIAAAAGRLIDQHPSAAGHLVAVLATAPVKEVAVVGAAELRRPFEAAVWRRFRPDCVLATGADASSRVPLLADRDTGPSGVRAFVCRGFVCDLPTDEVSAFEAQLTSGEAAAESTA